MTLTSASGATELRLARETPVLDPKFACPAELRDPETGENASVIYVDVELTGENGQRQMNDDRNLKCQVEGGRLLGFGSANPRTEQRYPDGIFATYYGKALAAVLVAKGRKATVKVSGESLAAELEVEG